MVAQDHKARLYHVVHRARVSGVPFDEVFNASSWHIAEEMTSIGGKGWHEIIRDMDGALLRIHQEIFLQNAITPLGWQDEAILGHEARI